MNIKKLLLLVISHASLGLAGFALGIYLLPILTAPQAPSGGALAIALKDSRYVAEMQKQRTDSDWLHWGQGKITLSDDFIVIQGELAPGPDYRMYLSDTFIETEQDFLAKKPNLVQVSQVPSFGTSIHALPAHINIEDYNTVIIWCEAFGQYITSAQYKP